MKQAELAPLIAIVGCDGSGKSTVAETALAEAQLYGPAELVHMGKQSGNIGRALENLPLVGDAIGRLIAKKTDSTRAQREKKVPGFLVSLVIFAFFLRRVLRFRRMMKKRKSGLIIISDRYPQLDVPDGYDGTGMSVTAPGNPLVRWMARRELAAVKRMIAYVPDMVIRLHVDIDTACARKPDHRRKLLEGKVTTTPKLKFNGARLVDIDSCQPLDDVLAAARQAVDEALEQRGYAKAGQ